MEENENKNFTRTFFLMVSNEIRRSKKMSAPYSEINVWVAKHIKCTPRINFSKIEKHYIVVVDSLGFFLHTSTVSQFLQIYLKFIQLNEMEQQLLNK